MEMDTDLRFSIYGARLSSHLVERLWTFYFKGLSLCASYFTTYVDSLCICISNFIQCKYHICNNRSYFQATCSIDKTCIIMWVKKLVVNIYINVFSYLQNSRLFVHQNKSCICHLSVSVLFVRWLILTLLIFSTYSFCLHILTLYFHDGKK